MSYRFTNTDKWRDSWFSELTPYGKLLFIYFCDNCDIAGFYEINPRRIVFETGLSNKNIEESLKGLQRGFWKSKRGSWIFIINFIRHQKNFPINPSNSAHKGIIKSIESHLQDYECDTMDTFFTELQKYHYESRGLEAPTMGLDSPIGKGIGKGNGKNKEGILKGNHKFSETHYRIAKEFHELKSKTHGTLNAITNANLEAWADEVRKLEEIDGKNLELIEKVLSFALGDSFWINNLQSLQGIRNKNKDGISKFEMIEVKSTPKRVEDYELTNSTTEE